MEDARPSPRRSVLLAVGAVVLVVAIGVAFLLLREPGTATSARTCNGAAALCDLRLDEVGLATTHNAMNSAAEAFRFPNQERGIEAQLEDGVRGFLVDAYLGSVSEAGSEQIVYTELDDRRLAQMVKAAGDEPAGEALRLREQAGPPRRTRPARCTSATSSASSARCSSARWSRCCTASSTSTPARWWSSSSRTSCRPRSCCRCSRQAVSTRTSPPSTRASRCRISARWWSRDVGW